MTADMGAKITVTAEKDGRTVIFEGSGTLTTTERVGKWVDTRSTSMSRDVHGVEIEWDGTYTIREADHLRDTLDDLAAEWEAAEIPTDDTPIRAGDVMIYPIPDGHAVRRALVDGGLWRSDTRVLSRAPQREPWQDLADVLSTDNGELIGEHRTITEVAKSLHELGVRVVGGEES